MSNIIKGALTEIDATETNKDKFDIINNTIDEIDGHEYENVKQLALDCELLERILQALYLKKGSITYEEQDYGLYQHQNTREEQNFYMEYLTLRREISQLYDFNEQSAVYIDGNDPTYRFQNNESDQVDYSALRVLQPAQQVYEHLQQYTLERQTYKDQLEKGQPTALLTIFPNPTTGIVTLKYNVQLYAGDVHNTFGKREYQGINSDYNFYEGDETFNPLHGLPTNENRVTDINTYVDERTKNIMATDALAERNRYINFSSGEKVNKDPFASIIEEPGAGTIYSPTIQRQTINDINPSGGGGYWFDLDQSLPAPRLGTFPNYNPQTMKPWSSQQEATDRAHEYLIHYMKQAVGFLNTGYPKVYAMNGRDVSPPPAQRTEEGTLQGEYTTSIDLSHLADGIYVVVVPDPSGDGLISTKVVKMSQ